MKLTFKELPKQITYLLGVVCFGTFECVCIEKCIYTSFSRKKKKKCEFN